MRKPSQSNPGAATARLLLQQIPPIEPGMRTDEVFGIFSRFPARIALPVVDEGVPVGLVIRKTLIEHFARPFTRELFGRKPISAFMETAPLIVEIDMDLDDLSRMILEAGMQHMYGGFIVVDDGKYAGMGTGYELMRLMTERKQAHLYDLAHYDSLTGLPNRLLLEDRLNQALARAGRQREMVALLFLDLDRFKFINDTLGHPAGDLLLRFVAARLGDRVRRSDTVARMGGDEFMLVVPGISGAQEAAQVAENILADLAEPFDLEGQEVFVTVSIGIAVYPVDDGDASAATLIKNADAAMYKAKEQGKNNYQFYTAQMNAENLDRLRLENKLRKAIEREEFLLHYQPRVDCMTGAVTGVEALVRWHEPGDGLIAPSKFVPLAEENGLIVPLGEWVLQAACAQSKAWQEMGLPALRVAVNLSSRQFKRHDLIKTVERVLVRTGLDAGCLELELTESVAMENAKATVATLLELKAMGVKLAIDDFGTGYSSLGYLKRFPIDSIKIDKSFVRDLPADEDDAAIVKAIIALSHSLALRVVAEGVETAEQLAFLRANHCEEMQGFLYSRPLAADELVRLVLEGRAFAAA